MSAVPAYSRYNEAPFYSPVSSPRIDVVPGRGAEQGLNPLFITLAKIAVAVVFVVALLGIARITFNSATVSTALEAQQISTQIDTARSEGSKLEVTQSTLSNPTRIKEMATALGMSSPETTTYINLSDGNDVNDIPAPVDAE